MDNETTNQTTDNTNVEQPIDTTKPVDGNTTTPSDSSTTTTEPTNIESNTNTPIEPTTPSTSETTIPIQPSGENTNVETPVTNNNNEENTTTPVTLIEIPSYIEVYDYDANGYYIGVDIADRSPLDKEVVYLLPANSTKIKPPEITVGKISKWNGESWDIVDRPNDVVINDEINKSNDEVVNSLKNTIVEQQIKLDAYEKRIVALEQLVSGIIATNITVS